MVTVAVAPENLPAIAAGRPELICLPLSEMSALVEAIERADVVAIGARAWAALRGPAARWMPCSPATKPLVVDADALNLIAEGRRARAPTTGS